METFILKEIKKTSELIESLLFKYSSEFFKDYKDLHFKIVYNLKEKGLRIRPFYSVLDMNQEEEISKIYYLLVLLLSLCK